MIFSMRFALILLGILVAACVAGSVIPQGEAPAYYLSEYSQSAGGAILALGLDDVFHCAWFIVLAAILCLNLLGCNLVRFPSLIRQTKEGFTAQRYLRASRENLFDTGNPRDLFRKCGFHALVEGQTPDGIAYVYAVKKKIGIWGAWVCHLGMLIVIIGFGLGQMMQEKYAVYGVPGQTKSVEGTPYELTIDEFEVALREDDTVDQYTASITMRDTKTGESRSGQTSVNHPTTLFGMRCYQNSTGWAATVQVWKEEELIQEEVLCAGETLQIKDKDSLALVFAAFYPDYVEEEGGPRSASSKLNNPAYLYRLYYQNEVLGMNVLMAKEAITIDQYTIIFTNPQNYTLIQIKRDPFTWLAAVGAAIVVIGLLLAFYCRTAQVMALQQPDGRWAVSGYSRKGGAEFVDMLKEKYKELEGGTGVGEGQEGSREAAVGLERSSDAVAEEDPEAGLEVEKNEQEEQSE